MTACSYSQSSSVPIRMRIQPLMNIFLHLPLQAFWGAGNAKSFQKSSYIKCTTLYSPTKKTDVQ